MQSMLVDLVQEKLEAHGGAYAGPPESVAQFIVGSFLAISIG